MRKSRFSQEEIVGILREREAGAKMSDLLEEHRFSGETYYVWRSRHGGAIVGEAQRLRHIEDENRRLKQLIADLSLDRASLKAEIRKRGINISI